ncbi:MAG: response regulator receiver protein [Atopobiaceae bacterium]|nr:response regulator receiver protein [Atopobiaceae bacterium]
MAFDPQREDYQRLGLRFAKSLDTSGEANATRAFASFGRRFAQDRDSLPQSDSDRAFHLVAMATKLIDYELPFANDDHAQQLIESGHRLLDEALSLDARCYDALRMKTAAISASFEAFYAFLGERVDEVRSYCEEQRAAATVDENGERARLLADLAMRPYLRWRATQAEQALICGRNKEALVIAQDCLSVDEHDAADIRFTASLAFAKLEDEQGLEAMHARLGAKGRLRPATDAWTTLARLALAFKSCDFDGARQQIKALLHAYPHAAEALIRQNELPDGVFARLAVLPFSEDELILALSEGTVLLQEGVDPEGRGVLSTWVMQEVAQMRPQAMLAVMAAQAEQNTERPQ